MSRHSRTLLLASLALVGWFTLVMLTWAVQPLSDTMTVGRNAKGEFVVKETECGSLFDSSPTAGRPVPVLHTPDGIEQEWAFPRTPCVLVHEQARTLFGINVATLVLGILAVAFIALRSRKHSAPQRVAIA